MSVLKRQEVSGSRWLNRKIHVKWKEDTNNWRIGRIYAIYMECFEYSSGLKVKSTHVCGKGKNNGINSWLVGTSVQSFDWLLDAIINTVSADASV